MGDFLYTLMILINNLQTLALFILATLLSIFFIGVVSIRLDYIKNKFSFEEKFGRFLTTIVKFVVIFITLGLMYILFITIFILLQEAGIIYLGYS